MPTKVTRPAVSRWGGFDYEVRYAPPGTLKYEGEEAYGLTDHNTQDIQVEDGLKPERECATLIHEACHQMIGTAKAVFKGEPEDIEEDVCTFLGDAIAGHIRDNPDFWRFLIKRLVPRKRKPKPHDHSEEHV